MLYVKCVHVIDMQKKAHLYFISLCVYTSSEISLWLVLASNSFDYPDSKTINYLSNCTIFRAHQRA